MGHVRKVEGSSFPMVVVLDRTSHFIARNLYLKMGFFRRKTAVIGQLLGMIQQKFQELLVL
jgi:hypothetical protein